MNRLLISMLIVAQLTGCATTGGYVGTNCINGPTGACNRDEDETFVIDETQFLLRSNLLHIKDSSEPSYRLATNEEALAFALLDDNYVVKYSPSSEVAAIHRRVVDVRANPGATMGEVVLDAAFILLGVAILTNSRSCFDRHLDSFKKQDAKTRRLIWHSDDNVVGTEKWHHDINRSQRKALNQLSAAYACL